MTKQWTTERPYIANVDFRGVGYKILVNKVTLAGFSGGDRPTRPPWMCPCTQTFD